MNDSEIIKVLECCLVLHKCEECPCDFDTNGKTLCNDLGLKILDLINRQQSEIERLHSMNQTKLDMIHDIRAELETAKSATVKEFAERYKKEITERYEDIAYKDLFFGVIDRLIEEMGCNDDRIY